MNFFQISVAIWDKKNKNIDFKKTMFKIFVISNQNAFKSNHDPGVISNASLLK
jgi:hypothetical protein